MQAQLDYLGEKNEVKKFYLLYLLPPLPDDQWALGE